MRSALACALALLSASAAHASMLDSVKAGKLQCYAPNDERKTCASLAGYSFAGGKIMNLARVLVSPDPPVVMITNSPVVFHGDAICGRIAKADIDAAAILVNGQALPGPQAAGVKAQLWQALAPRAGKEVCTTYAPASGDSFKATATVDGKPDGTAPEMTVKLVDPSDGYRVAP